MAHRTLIGVVAWVGLIPDLALAQAASGAERVADDPDKLVALMAGEDLPRASMMRAIPRTPAWNAAEKLIRMKDDAVPALARGLESDDRLIRLNVVYVLNGIDTPATLPLRIKSAGDPDPEVRVYALVRLPAYKNQEARQVLLKALKDPEPSVRNAAVAAFQRSWNRNEEKNLDNQVRFNIARALIPMLDDPATQQTAAVVLGRLGSNVASVPLLKLLKAQSGHVRSAAVGALGRLKDKQVTVELTAVLRDADPYLRRQAADALGAIGDLRATPALIQSLSDSEFPIRRDSASALGMIGDVRAVPSLLPLLDDPEWRVRNAAAEALGQIGDVHAVEPLCKLLAHAGREDASVARALGRLHDPRAIEPLTQYLFSAKASRDGSQEAVKALGQIRHPEAVAALVKVILQGGKGNARSVLSQVTGKSFWGEPMESIAEWWERNREDYLRSVPDEK